MYSSAEIIEKLDKTAAMEMYKQNIKFWQQTISDLIMQANLYEIAEIYVKIADIYGDKLQDDKSKKQNVMKSIKYLEQESKLLIEFNETESMETRKLTQNYQNVAELYEKIFNYKKSIKFYEKVIKVAKLYKYYDILSYSYQKIANCYEQLDDYSKSEDIMLDGVDYFSNLYIDIEEKGDSLALAQICQILKTLYEILDDKNGYSNYSKKEAGAYINLAESLEKNEENYPKIARYYRGAGLCYQETTNNLIESASCFILAGNYCEKIGEFSEAAINFIDAAQIFRKLNNFEQAYKNFIKPGEDLWKSGDINQSTECYLNAYDVAIEGKLEFNRYGIFTQIVRGLSKIAEEGIKNKQFYTAATVILESIKFYEQMDISRDYFLRQMVRTVYKYYYKAANLKTVGFSHIVHSYVCASLSSILNGKLTQAWKIISEIDLEGNTVANYKELVKIIIDWVSKGKKVEAMNLPFNIKRLIEGSEEILYIISLFNSLQPPLNLLS